ncbi:BTB/POZ domain-containing protein [Phthorimaea operculella]|nr:BTB/POZ domain-containing protein [Phthorimaea operculella]
MSTEKKMALPPQQFCVRWNSYHTNLQAVFPRLLLTEQFADVTLACESRQLRCHKLVLSACSAYLERLLTQNPCKHPIVLMRDMRMRVSTAEMPQAGAVSLLGVSGEAPDAKPVQTSYSVDEGYAMPNMANSSGRTLVCESRQLRCHKLVLSACSAYLERLLTQNPCKHPIVLMRDMRFIKTRSHTRVRVSTAEMSQAGAVSLLGVSGEIVDSEPLQTSYSTYEGYACESRQLRCHKLVLSACSAYLERLLTQNPCKHPIVLMRDMRVQVSTAEMSQAGAVSLLGVSGEIVDSEPLQTSYSTHEGYALRCHKLVLSACSAYLERLLTQNPCKHPIVLMRDMRTLVCESRQLRSHKLVLSACSAYLERLLTQNPCKHPIVLMRDMRTLVCESRQLRCHKLVLSACSAYLERLLTQNPCKHPIVLMRDMRKRVSAAEMSQAGAVSLLGVSGEIVDSEPLQTSYSTHERYALRCHKLVLSACSAYLERLLTQNPCKHPIVLMRDMRHSPIKHTPIKTHTDVTLVCESRQLRCHKLVLSACSAYLERLLTQNPCKHPIVLMRDMRKRVSTAEMPQAGAVSLLGVSGEIVDSEPLQTSYSVDEGYALRCRKLVLSACSAYLERLLTQNPCKHPIVLMRDMRKRVSTAEMSQAGAVSLLGVSGEIVDSEPLQTYYSTHEGYAMPNMANSSGRTLVCESRQLRCHKLVLSACSAYLERLLTQNPCKHPIVLMRDMRFSEMQALVDFMYKGEVNVTQEELPSLLKSAEALQIRGLCSSDNAGLSEFGAKPESKDYTVASEALVAHAQRDSTSSTNGTTHTSNSTSNGSTTAAAPTKKRKSEERADDRASVKEETVEEDGLYYGELDADNMEYNEDEEPGKPGSSLGQASGRGQPFLRVKPESELFFQTKLQNLAKANSDYIQRLAKMNPSDIQKEFSKYGLTNTSEEYLQKTIEKNENDYYKSWLEQNGELEVSLLRASQVRKPKIDLKNQKSEVELIPKTKSSVANKEIYPKIGEKAPIRRRGRPPIFKDKNVDIGETVLKSDLDQFLEGKEVSSSGLSRKDLERVMMGKFNPNRRYSNEAMWAALMDVKKGGSIYRAAQTHKVPRKSLRNWMKRCHIKSSFPMPQQLKQFVENSKKQKEYNQFYQDGGHFQDGSNFGEKSGTEAEQFEPDVEFGKHFLSFASATVSSEDEVAMAKNDSGEIGSDAGNTGGDSAAIDMSVHE